MVIILNFSDEELRKAEEVSDFPLDTVIQHLREIAFARRADLFSAGEGVLNSLTELEEIRKQIETVSREIAAEGASDGPAEPEKKSGTGSGRWKRFISSASSQISSISSKIASTTRITALRRKENKLLTSVGFLFAQAGKEKTMDIPPEIKGLCERVLLLTKNAPQKEGEKTALSGDDLKTVFNDTVGFIKTAAGKAKKLISSEGLKSELRRLQNDMEEKLVEIGRLAFELVDPANIFPDIQVREIELLKQEVERLRKQLGGTVAQDGAPDNSQTEFFSSIARKTGGFIETERLKTELSQRQNDLKKFYLKTGEAINKQFITKNLTEDSLKHKCKLLKALSFSIRQKELEVKRIMEEVSGDDLATMLHKRMSQEDAEELDQKIMERYGRHLTIMFTDLKDFTRKSAELEMVEMMEMMQEHDDLIIPVLEEHLGRIVKKIGDAVMAVFENPVNAVKSAVAVQRKLLSRNLHVIDPSRKIQIRIGINCGTVLEKEGDVYGDPVNMASRVEGLAKEEQIFITRDVFDFLDEDEIPCKELQPQKVKGKDEPVPIYEVSY
ncbi:MAG: adenylate/guanylate cyclase domain-containing protein [bacterium]|jgi:class 3 adenylate cyclase|nr:adenylate/guanylate cyclase domain-containing protein [bacterium]